MNTPPPPADPRDLASSFDDVDDFADDLDTGELVTSGLADPAVGASGAEDRRSRLRRTAIER